MPTKGAKGFFKIFDVVGFLETFDKHVIDINLHVLINLVLENFVDQPLVGSSYIFQTKGYYIIIINTFFDDDSSVLFIFKSHSYLIIAWESIHEAK